MISSKTITMTNQQIRDELFRVQQDPYRLHFHLMPPIGSLADPNGMCQIKGTYHIYYVHNPMACLTEKRTACVWGHYSTEDFIHFQCEKTAIEPSHERDQDGVYSGCSLYENNKLYVWYTGNVRYTGHYDYIHEGREQNVMMIESMNAIDFENKTLVMTNEDFPGNMTKHVRDPQVFKEDNYYYMVLGARNRENQGLVLIYQSQDMFHWKYINQLTTSQTFGYMWECPDLIMFNQQRILIACPQGIPAETYRFQNKHQCGYFQVQGDFKTQAKLSGFEQFDYGFDFYAARSFLNQKGERILIGWMGMSEADYTMNMTRENGWMQALAMPRVLSYYHHHIYQAPMEAMKELRLSHQVLDLRTEVLLHAICFECLIHDIHNQSLTIWFREDCFLNYHEGVLLLDMGTCGDGRTQRRVNLDSLYQLHIFSDTSALEIFINEGYCTMTTRIFSFVDTLKISCLDAKADFYELGKYEVKW